MSKPTGQTSDTRYLVVVNNEEQYSIWDESMPIPPGWRAEGFAGSKDDCLMHVGRVWTDMRPRSRRSANRPVAHG